LNNKYVGNPTGSCERYALIDRRCYVLPNKGWSFSYEHTGAGGSEFELMLDAVPPTLPSTLIIFERHVPGFAQSIHSWNVHVFRDTVYFERGPKITGLSQSYEWFSLPLTYDPDNYERSNMEIVEHGMD
jgi:hypothetical protein